MEGTHIQIGRTSRGAVLLLALIFIFMAETGNCYSWEKAKEEDGILIETRHIKGSVFKEYRGFVTIKAPVSRLISAVFDVKAYPLWVDTCTEGKILSRENGGMIAYTANDAPWPVADRDAVVVNRIFRDTDTGVVTITIGAKPDLLTESKAVIRVKIIDGFWKFIPRREELTDVIYQVHTDPGGSIPSWLVNTVVVTQPFKTLKNLRQIMER